MTKIILDPGSCHMANMEYAKELTKVAAGCGADAIKWQLFKNDIKERSQNPGKYPNIELPREWFPELVELGESIGIEVFASAFDDEAICLINKYCSSIKFSYGFNKNHSIKYLLWPTLEKPFENIYVSGDVMTEFPDREKIKRLFCINQYPVPFAIDFEWLFGSRFDGFSDHSLSYWQTIKAVEKGARIIEKHFTLDRAGIVCPDSCFALHPNEVEEMIKEIRILDGGF